MPRDAALIRQCLQCQGELHRRTVTWVVNKPGERIAPYAPADGASEIRQVVVPALPRSREDCKGLTTERILGHTYAGLGGDRYVCRFVTWDGKTFAPKHGYFCSTGCAADYGERAAREREKAGA